MLMSYMSVGVRLLQFMNQYDTLLSHSAHLTRLSWVCAHVFLPCQAPVQDHIAFSCHVSLVPLGCGLRILFFFFLQFWGVWYLFDRMSPNWGLSHVFLMIKLRLWVFGRKTAEIKCPSHHVVSRPTASAGPSLPLTLTTGLRLRVLSCHFALLHAQCPLWKEAVTSAHI